MRTIKVRISDQLGIHARPASIVISTASKFESELTLLTENDKKANMKSVMQVLSLAVRHDAVVTITAEGSDEDKAIEAIKEALVKNELVLKEDIRD